MLILKKSPIISTITTRMSVRCMKSDIAALPTIVSRGNDERSVMSTPKADMVIIAVPLRINPDIRTAKYPALIPFF
ncbi:hypothetical protein D3C80_2145490 [compost metagenome]